MQPTHDCTRPHNRRSVGVSSQSPGALACRACRHVAVVAFPPCLEPRAGGRSEHPALTLPERGRNDRPRHGDVLHTIASTADSLSHAGRERFMGHDMPVKRDQGHLTQ